MLSSATALQLGDSLARLFIDSPATPVDWDIGSGNHPSYVPELWLCPTKGIRIGEASHPGPVQEQDSLLTVGIGNPGGLRTKEDLVLSLGPGIWTMAETQLSSVTTTTTARALRAGGRKMNRSIRPLFGHPAPLRHGSQWAGKWTGVCTMSDWPASMLTLPWPAEHWQTGRLLVTRHWVDNVPITIGGFYGYAQGPTWPQAKQQSDQLLQTLTKEIVMGMSGIRMIVGDFNFEPGELTQHHLWMRYGWHNAQTLAAVTQQHEWRPTCKNANERDQIWLSPEASSLLRGIHFHDQFADHLTVAVQLQIPRQTGSISRWPRPSAIPWDDINTEEWNPSCTIHPDDFADTTDFMKSWAHAFEDAASQEHVRQHGAPIHRKSRGRAQRTEPDKQPLETIVCKPSREGEVCLQNSLVGKAVRNWYTPTFYRSAKKQKKIFFFPR